LCRLPICQMGVECRVNSANTPVTERKSNTKLASPLNTIANRLPRVHSHSAHANQKAAGAIAKTPITEIRLTAISGAEMIASDSFHRCHAIRHTARPAASQTAAITLDVTQSQVTTGDSLFAEQLQGLDVLTCLADGPKHGA